VGDVDCALKYAFDVIRGFSSVRLPDELHTFLAMKAFENTEHQGIKNYFSEISSDRSRVADQKRDQKRSSRKPPSRGSVDIDSQPSP
jgi:hypothetical protein